MYYGDWRCIERGITGHTWSAQGNSGINTEGSQSSDTQMIQ